MRILFQKWHSTEMMFLYLYHKTVLAIIILRLSKVILISISIVSFFSIFSSSVIAWNEDYIDLLYLTSQMGKAI